MLKSTSRTRYLAAALIYAFSFFSSAQSVFASDTSFYSGNDILYYNEEASICGQGADSTATPSVVVDNSDNLKSFLIYFTGKGFSLAAAAGMAGNIKQESSFNPAVIQGGEIADDDVDIMQLKFSNGEHKGFGIAQWTSSDRKQNLVNFAEGQGKPITDLGLQLDFMWKEMSDSGYQYMVQKLNENKTDPVAAAIVFHGLTPNIELEGAGIHPTFAAAGAQLGYERSGDTSTDVVNNRGGAARAYYNQNQGEIADGTGVTGVTEPVETDTETQAPVCNDEPTPSDLGVGRGDFTDNGEVAAWGNVLKNSQATDRLFGDRLEGDGWCAAITSRVWRGENIGYGVHYAVTLWENNNSNGIGHADRSPKKGAILIYSSDTQAAGHVTIYLGGNKILNDGKIRDASYAESDWGLHYLGWIDPNDLGWESKLANDSYFTSTLSEYDE